MALTNIYVQFIFFQLLLCAGFLIHFFNVAAAPTSTDTIVEGKCLGLSQTITSASQVFELGFFSPQNSTKFYIGIWYKKIEPRTVVWVGNRDLALTGPYPYLTLGQGDLVIVDDRVTYSVSNLSSASNTRLSLLDSGNLVLRDASNLDILWQSFDYPTDTFLPGMRPRNDKRSGKVWSLTAWEKENDPSPGAVSMKCNPRRSDEFIIMKGDQTYWSSGPWSGGGFPYLPEVALNYLYNINFIIDENLSLFTYAAYDTSVLKRVVLDGISGQLRLLNWHEISKQWVTTLETPGDICNMGSFCGPFSSCRNYSRPYCQCLEGFSPADPRSWEQDDASGGCARKVPLQCGNDTFKMMLDVGFPPKPNITHTKSREACKSSCLRECSCNAYAFNGTGWCFSWSGDLLNLRQFPEGDPIGGQLYIKIAVDELQKNQDKRSVGVKIIVAAIAPFVLLSLVSYVYYRWKMKQKRKREAAEDMLWFDADMMGASTHTSEHPTNPTNRSAKTKDFQLPQFSFASISAATYNFSPKNKLGEGGFGPVYKGKLPNGQEVAVKRLSRKSNQGLQELRNEMKFNAKLQHKNLVRILGYCLEKGENILIYELMPNRSLDSFLFDPSKQHLLDWSARARIIEGIAQGLLYLHEHSRIRIIHRDLKAGNILLDKDMTPRISDFGLAKMFSGNESQANTNHIVGTYGYMSPEYALQGLCSIKSDVFSFGVLLLEIISGKRNTGFYHSDSLNLLSYAWELWNGGITLQLVDPVLDDRCSDDKMMRYINIAFLCVDEIAANRPAMSEVVSMLTNQNPALPPPRQPAFLYLRHAPSTTSNNPSTLPELRSRNDVTISAVEAR